MIKHMKKTKCDGACEIARFPNLHKILSNKFMISSSTQMHKFTNSRSNKMYPIVDQMFKIYIFQMATCAIGLAFLYIRVCT
jgi:hypothetical protein